MLEPGEDTAVLDVANGDEPEESLEALFAAPLSDEPEGDEPDSGKADETTETVESPLDGMDINAIAELPQVKAIRADIEARLGESYRQRELNAQRQAQAEAEQRAFAQQEQNFRNVQSGAVQTYLNQLMKDALERGQEITPDKIAPAANALTQAVFHQAFNALSTTDQKWLSETLPDYRPSQEVVAALDGARRAGKPQALAEAQRWLLREALWQAQWPYALQAAQEDWEAQQKVNGVRSAAATRNSQPRPTTVSAPAAKMRRYSVQEIEDMPMVTWNQFSDTEKQRILETAR